MLTPRPGPPSTGSSSTPDVVADVPWTPCTQLGNCDDAEHPEPHDRRPGTRTARRPACAGPPPQQRALLRSWSTTRGGRPPRPSARGPPRDRRPAVARQDGAADHASADVPRASKACPRRRSVPRCGGRGPARSSVQASTSAGRRRHVDPEDPVPRPDVRQPAAQEGTDDRRDGNTAPSGPRTAARSRAGTTSATRACGMTSKPAPPTALERARGREDLDRGGGRADQEARRTARRSRAAPAPCRTGPARSRRRAWPPTSRGGRRSDPGDRTDGVEVGRELRPQRRGDDGLVQGAQRRREDQTGHERPQPEREPSPRAWTGVEHGSLRRPTGRARTRTGRPGDGPARADPTVVRPSWPTPADGRGRPRHRRPRCPV